MLQDIGSGGASTWDMAEQEADDVSVQTKVISGKRKRKSKKREVKHSDSEEEETITLQTPG